MALEYIGLRLCKVVAKSVSLLFVVGGLWLSWSSSAVAATTQCHSPLYGASGAVFNASNGQVLAASLSFFQAQFNSSRFAGSSQLAGAYLGSAPFSYTVPAITKFCAFAPGIVLGVGFTPGPTGVWDPAEGGWVYPTSGGPGKELVSWEWVFRIKPQGQKLAYEPGAIPFMQSSTVGGTPSFPSFTVELVLRATNRLGQDAGKDGFYAFTCGTESTCIGATGYLGTFHDLQTTDTSTADILTKQWVMQPEGLALRLYNGGLTAGVGISLESSYCKLGGHTYGYWNSSLTQNDPGSTLAFDLPPVLGNSFSGVGSVVEAGVGGRGSLTSVCIKYDPEQIRMTVQVVGGVAAPGLESQGVALGNASDPVGIQLLYSDKADPVDADLRPVNLSAPIDLNKTFLTKGNDNVPSAAYVFNGVTYNPAYSINKYGGVSFRARYYQVKPSITAHAISVTYQITQDVN